MLKRFRNITNANALARRFGGSGGFNPTLYGTLLLWLDAADVSGTGTNPSNGTAITSWKDKSGLANHATNVGSPVLDSTGVNGNPGILLNGISMGFRGSVINTGSVCTTFVVVTLNNDTGGNARLVSLAGSTGDDYNNNSYIIPFLRPSGSLQNVAGFRNNTTLSSKSTPTYDTPFQATSVFDGTNNSVYVNGSGASPINSFGPLSISKYAIGTQPNNDGDWWKGYVSEVLIYNSVLSTTNREIVESYLATKWGI